MSDEYAFPYQKKEGELHIPRSNRAGKKFQDWSFKPANGERFVIEVNLLYPTSKNKKFMFSASSINLSKSFESSDIEELRALVENDLQRRAYLFNGIVWEEWYEVKVSGTNEARRGGKSSLEIKYGKIKKGVDKEGNEVMLHNNNVVLPFPKSKKYGHDSKESYIVTTNEEISYIPATEKNTRALETVTKKLGELRDEMTYFLSQDSIEETFKLGVDTKLIS